MSWWSPHTHSIYSTLDSTALIGRMVEKVAGLGQPALALTDHGNMAGSVQLYRHCRKHDVLPFPGVETYLIDPAATEWANPPRNYKVDRYHLGLMALDEQGYKALVKFVSMTHTRPRFSRFPRCTLDDLAVLGKEAGQHIALTTGCFFGLVQQTLVRGDEDKAHRIIKMFASWFPHTFVELQNHDITHTEGGDVRRYNHDDHIVTALDAFARQLGLPVLATQDSHYIDKVERKAHRMMKTMVYGSTEDAFPGDYFHVANEGFVRKHYDEDVWSRVLEGHDQLLSLNKLKIEPLDNYRMHVPDVAKSPMNRLTQLVEQALTDSGLVKPAYRKRLNYELDVIDHLGMANYFLMWKRIIDYARSKSIFGEARGSANGSLVLFLLRITQVDPIIEDTTFDRFLSKDRKKPPDIDWDVEDVNRERIIAFTQRTWPGAVRIGTWSKLGANEEGTGSALVTYKSWRARQAEAEVLEDEFIPKKERSDRAKAAKQAVYVRLQTLEDVRQEYGENDYTALMQLSSIGAGVQGGKFGVFKSYGVHAAGTLLSGTDVKIED